MLKWFQKKEKAPTIMTEETILKQVEKSKLKNHKSAFFHDAQISEKTYHVLTSMGFSIRVRPTFFEIFWK